MNPERLMKVLLGPHISEKGTTLADQHGQYVFEVVKDATKPEIKLAIEHLFNVEVIGVRVVNTKGKSRRFKQMLGRRKNWKKAYVSLKEGQDINFVGKE